MLIFIRKIIVLFIYITFFIINLCRTLILVKFHFSNNLLKKKYIFIEIVYQIICNLIILSIILLYFSLFIWILIPITSKNIMDFFKKIGIIIILLFCCILILNFKIFRYLFIIFFFIWEIKYKLFSFYNKFETYFRSHKLVCFLYIINEILYELCYYLMNSLNQYIIKMTSNLIKLPLY